MGHDESSVGAAGGPPEFDETLGTSDQTSPRSPGGGSGGAERAGESIGPYRLVSQIGEGGFGVVWLAERREPIVQRVALKIIKAGMDTRAVVARFEQERQALAVMEHPNIAKVFDAGTTPREMGSRPYFVMEYVKGEPITGFCDRHKLTIRERLELFIPVCEAVQHAHMKGVIHRDIKPSNILVSASDGKCVPKVIDFGVAKAVSHSMTEKTIFTERGALIGTPEYMSPEQAEMGATDIDTRSDVYSLGVVLYELLSGTLPFDASTLRSAGYAEVQRIIREVDPPRPSTRLSTADETSGAAIAKARQADRERIAAELRRELEWIPLKALRKDRSRRYASAEALGADVRRYLDGRALEAAPESRTYLFRKFVNRNRAQVGAVAAVLVALSAGLGVALWQRSEAERNRTLAELSARDAIEQKGLAEANEREALEQKRLAELSEAEAQQQRAAAEASSKAEAEARRRAEAVRDFIREALVAGDPSQGGRSERTVVEAMANAVGGIDSGVLKEQPDTQVELLLTISRILDGNGQSEQALGLAERALQIRRALNVVDDARTAECLNDVGACLLSLGRSQAALERFEQALEIRRRLLGAHSEEVAETLTNVASCQVALGASPEVITLVVVELMHLFEALTSTKRESGDANVWRPAPKLRHAMFQCLYYATQGLEGMMLDEISAVRTAREMESLKAQLKKEWESSFQLLLNLARGSDVDTAVVLSACGRVERLLGHPMAAEVQLEKALQLRLSVYGGDQPSIALGRNDLAECYLDRGRVEDAASEAHQSVEMYERLFKEGHPFRARAMGTLALVLDRQGKREEAMILVARAEEMARAKEPPTGPNVRAVLRAKKRVMAETAESDGEKK